MGELERQEPPREKASKPRTASKRGRMAVKGPKEPVKRTAVKEPKEPVKRMAVKEPKEPVKRKISNLEPRLSIGNRTIKLIALDDYVSVCPVKKALIATKTAFKEV